MPTLPIITPIITDKPVGTLTPVTRYVNADNLNVADDATIRGHATVKGNLRVEGWLDADNLRVPFKGLFASDADLKAAYPAPTVGMCAFVGSGATATVYRSNGLQWVNTGQQAVFTVEDRPVLQQTETLRADLTKTVTELSTLKKQVQQSPAGNGGAKSFMLQVEGSGQDSRLRVIGADSLLSAGYVPYVFRLGSRRYKHNFTTADGEHYTWVRRKRFFCVGDRSYKVIDGLLHTISVKPNFFRVLSDTGSPLPGSNRSYADWARNAYGAAKTDEYSPDARSFVNMLAYTADVLMDGHSLIGRPGEVRTRASFIYIAGCGNFCVTDFDSKNIERYLRDDTDPGLSCRIVNTWKPAVYYLAFGPADLSVVRSEDMVTAMVRFTIAPLRYESVYPVFAVP